MKLNRFFVFILIIILLSLLSIFYPYLTGEKTINPVEYEKENCFVDRVIDGDTLVCDNETIRLLGIDNREVEINKGFKNLVHNPGSRILNRNL